MVFEKVAGMIAKQLRLDVSEVTADKRLVEDLKADSANVMVLIMDLEDAFDMMVDDTAINTLKTVGDVVKYIESKQQQPFAGGTERSAPPRCILFAKGKGDRPCRHCSRLWAIPSGISPICAGR